MEEQGETGFLERAYTRLRAQTSPAAASAGTTVPPSLLPGADALVTARASLPRPSDPEFLVGRGREATLDHVLGTLAPALTGQNLGGADGGRYWGFVTGAVLPVAEAADNVASAYDQNVQVHLPAQTIATEVEDAALRMVLGLLRLDRHSGDGDGDESRTIDWCGRTFTTGATASNILGLACGREAVIRARLHSAAKSGGEEWDDVESVGELGLLQACARAGVDEIRVLTSAAHSSVAKAASVVGLGRASVVDASRRAVKEPWRLDLDAVERELARDPRVAHIVCVGAGEVNTGRFATEGLADMRRLRGLADKYRAWIHVDGAFGLFVRALPKTDEFARLHSVAEGLELADSITLDGHKLLNVPYDNGIFFTRKSSVLKSVFKNPNAAYLAAPTSPSAAQAAAALPGDDRNAAATAAVVESPLNLGIENSRRFRALPAYAALLSEGRAGYEGMLARLVRLARRIAGAVRSLPADYEVLADGAAGDGDGDGDINIVVLFRAKDAALNEVLADRIQQTGTWYASGTAWDGRPACRVAVANWRADAGAGSSDGAELVRRSLEAIAAEFFAARGG